MRRAATLALLLLSAAPLVPLVPAALSHPDAAGAALSAGRLGLLVRSIDLALAVGCVTTALGGAAAVRVWIARPRASRVALAVGALGLFVPPAAHAAAWASLAGTLALERGLAITVAAQVTAFLPLAFLLIWTGLASVPRDVIDAARTLGSDGRAVGTLAVRIAAPSVAISVALVALMSLGDYAVSSTFSVDTFAMDVFAEFAANGPAPALALAWPAVALAALVVLAVSGPIRSLAERNGAGGPVWHSPPRLSPAATIALNSAAAALIGAGASILVLLALGTRGPASAAAALVDAGPDLFTTAWIALAAAALVSVIALIGGVPPGPGRPLTTGAVGFAVAAIVTPPPVMGAGLIGLWNHPLSSAIYESNLMPVLASCARFAPLAMLVVAIAAGRLDQRVLEVALVGARPTRAMRTVVLPQLVPAVAAAALIVVALSAGELGATIMVLQPGTSTATVRAYNLLHYGASADVAAIALAIAGGGVLCAVLAARMLTHMTVRREEPM